MKQKKQPGFTIIEVVLFLAVSGLLAVGLMVGVSGAIQQQQYRDSVQSYANFLRTQQSRVVSVENERTPSQDCPLAPSGESSGRGQSTCVVVGRYIRSDDAGAQNGRKYQAYPVYARENSPSSWTYALGEADAEYATTWGVSTRLSSQLEGSTRVSVLMYRHPVNGGMHIKTASTHYHSGNIGAFLGSSVGDPRQAREVCIYERGFLVGQRQSVFISARAGSGDAITTGNASEGCADA